MRGVHPPGTCRPDNPQVMNLTTGEVRVLDRTHRQIPWIFQNRTLGVKCPGPPLASLGIKQPDSFQKGRPPQGSGKIERARGSPEETHADPTDSSSPCPHADSPSFQSSAQPLGSSGEPVSYTQMMYLQEAWGDDEWVPSAGAASSSQVPPQASIAHNTEAHLESSSSSPEETQADPVFRGL